MNKLSLLLPIVLLSSCWILRSGPDGPGPYTEVSVPTDVQTESVDPSSFQDGTLDFRFYLSFEEGTPPQSVAYRLNHHEGVAQRSSDEWYHAQVNLGATETRFVLHVGNAREDGQAAFGLWSLQSEVGVNEPVEAEEDSDAENWSLDFWDLFIGLELAGDQTEEAEEVVLPDPDQLTYPVPDFYSMLEWTEEDGIAWMLAMLAYDLDVDFDNDCYGLEDAEAAEFMTYLEYCPDNGYLDYSFVPMDESGNRNYLLELASLQSEMAPYYDGVEEIDELLYDSYSFNYSGRSYWVLIHKDIEEWYYEIYFEWE